jgi:phosphoglycerol transferase MdoB-like AlkP superfamily enzyme
VNALSRAGEVALGVIGTILNIILLIFVTLAVVGASNANTDELKQMFEEEIALSDPNMTPEDIAVFNDAVDVGIEVVGVVGWVVVVTLLISIILSILGVVKVSKNKSPKAAGIMFIFAGLLSGILLLAPILFYIAAIMCFVRKTPVQYVEDPYYNNEVQHQNQPQQPL